MWSIYWILLGKNLVIQKEIFLSSFCNGCGLDSTNPVCTSNPEDIHSHVMTTPHLICHGYKIGMSLWGEVWWYF